MNKEENSLLLRAALGQETERTPVWLMRQAGRILPEYRKVRASVSGFKELVTTPELAAEVTLQPVDILGVDAAIIFSDILVIPEAMGLPYEVIEKTGPVFENTINTVEDINSMAIAEGGELNYVYEAIRLVKNNLNHDTPLIGFAGAPWTILTYMVEGSGSKTFSKARRFLYTESSASHHLLDKITQSTIHYLKGQINAGANIIQLFDSWAGILGPEQYEEFGLKYIQRICEAITEVPIIVFAKGAYHSMEPIGKLSCNVIGIDWQTPIGEAQRFRNNKAIQGNMDPTVLYADTSTIKKHTVQMLEAFGPTGHIANLGHGVYPDTPLDGVRCFIDTVKEYQFKQ